MSGFNNPAYSPLLFLQSSAGAANVGTEDGDLQSVLDDSSDQFTTGSVYPDSLIDTVENGDSVATGKNILRVDTATDGAGLFELSGGAQTGAVSLLTPPATRDDFGTVRIDGVFNALVPQRYLDYASPAIMSLLTRAKIKPTIKPIFERVIRDVKSPDVFTPSQAFGYTSDGLVVKVITNLSGVAAAPDLLFLVPVNNGDSFSLSVDFSSASAVFVSFVGAAGIGGSYTTINATLTPTGNTYSQSGTSTGVHSYVGFRVRLNTTTLGATGLISDLSMVVNSSELVDFNNLYSTHKSTYATSFANDVVAATLEQFGQMNMRSFGVATGHQGPIWCSPTATPVSSAAPTALERTSKGTIDNPATVNDAIAAAQVMADNDIARPVIALLAGDYDASVDSLNAAIRADYINGSDCYIVAPFGRATFTSGGVLAGVFDNATSADGSALYLYNIEFDNTFNAPVKCQGRDLYALNCKTNSGTAASGLPGDGWDLDDNDFILQDCEATGSNNDGFNHHGYGHGVLVNCKSYANADDGFSPHDKCTYEVWGGEYYNNGKGNIIPAFGAQGFCVGVSSHDQNKTGPNVVDYNYGGFVALSGNERAGNEDRPTIMLLVDCVSEDDYIGINSAGPMSYVILSNNSVTDSIEQKIAQNTWGGYGNGAIIELDNQTLTGTGTDRTVTNVTRYRKYSPRVGSSVA